MTRPSEELGGPGRAAERVPQEAPAGDRATSSPPRGVISPRWRRRDRIQRRALLAADMVGLVLAFLLAAVIVAFRPDPWELVLLLLPTLPVWAGIFKLYGLYDRDVRRISHAGIDDLPYLFHALVVGGLLFWLYLKLGTGTRLVLEEALLAGVFAIPLLVMFRSAARRFVIGYQGAERVLIAGTGATSALVLRKIAQHPEYGLTPVGRLGPENTAPDHWDPSPEQPGPRPLHVPLLGSTEDLEQLLAENTVERAILCRADLEPDAVSAMADVCHRYGVKVGIVPGATDAYGPSVELDAVEGVTVLGVNQPVLGRTSRWLKRSFDVVVAAAILLLASPIAIAAMIAIPLDSRGPVFFRQQRVGKGGRVFRLYKFRTMVADAERQREELMASSSDPRWLHLEDDPRVTRVGRFLRRTSLDELPQLVNVLRGEMSLVGPRPLPVEEDAMVGGWARGRLDLTPGITGLWQVLGRTSIPFDEMVKLDYSYVTNWSLWMDVRLLLRTLPAVLSRRGAN